MKKYLLQIVMLQVLCLPGCGGTGEDEGHNFGNLFDSPGGIIVTKEEHEEGWGRSDCIACHPIEEIHRVNRTGSGSLSLENIRQFVLTAGLGSCSICHGDNGVTD